ncbi:Ctr copper transporter [Dissoconium aciculare CBS 342.82]|uniref:Copper transport protein n=1 Tax=Dissoconium aciculare CBS 342.82 TaxID=1314786 RepID=A0A6J3LVU0_9PEZI|nr:Ctr copper transporter [Dissoconium aciculare CBS 342.82]KAF1819394.1 Ctr copper transporter [Dissoconium aciculare CBS 342.82]
MDHSHHHGHGDMDASPAAMCSMNMLFTWDTTNLCIVFRSWRITGFSSLVISLIAIVALSAGYEAIKEAARQFEARSATGIAKDANNIAQQRAQLIKAVFYGVQVFYSFFIMLIFMTYNGWVMIAVGVGATVGHLVFGASSSPTKSAACH